MKLATDPTTAMLTELAQGKLAPAARRELARRALQDRELAAQMQLAMRLADGGAELARDWVAVAARPLTSGAGHWWRPLAGAAASLAIVAAVLFMPRTAPVEQSPPVAQHVQPQLPDQIGAGSFESPELFGGSFEAD